MFTIEKIKEAHGKVKSGADFPRYIKDLKEMGVVSYETWVTDGNTEFFGRNNYKAKAPARYSPVPIADFCNEEEFRKYLKAHQEGKSDYPTVSRQCAQSGIEKWIVSTEQMTCTYFDKAGNVVLVEEIPS